LRKDLQLIAAQTTGPINVNLFIHVTSDADPVGQLRWRSLLAPYYVGYGIDPAATISGKVARLFDTGFANHQPTPLERVHVTGASS
jgi:nitronate monooxygenase